MCTAFLRFTRPWCNGSFSFSQVTHIWWCLSFGCRQFNLACFGSLGCHGPTPDTQNNTRAFLALSSTISFIPTRLVLFLSLWRLDSILYYLLFLLSFPCRPLSDTSSLSVLLHCVLVEEDLWACSRHSSPHKKIKNIERAPPQIPHPMLALLSAQKIWSMAICFFTCSPVLSLTFECPLPFLIFFFCLFLLQCWQSSCFYGDSVARVHDKWSRPAPLFLLLPIQASLFRSVTVSCLSRKYISFSAMSLMSLVFLVYQSSPFPRFLSKIRTLAFLFESY